MVGAITTSPAVADSERLLSLSVDQQTGGHGFRNCQVL